VEVLTQVQAQAPELEHVQALALALGREQVRELVRELVLVLA
jgi:hypothetical protein